MTLRMFTAHFKELPASLALENNLVSQENCWVESGVSIGWQRWGQVINLFASTPGPREGGQ